MVVTVIVQNLGYKVLPPQVVKCLSLRLKGKKAAWVRAGNRV